MEIYGVFSPSISNIRHEWATLRSVWTDPTAQTYDCMNENMEFLTQSVWTAREQSAAGDKMVRDNYDKGECDRVLYSLHCKVAML